MSSLAAGDSHRQVWVRVNAPVDEGVAEIVSILSSVDELQTIESCQGEPSANPQGTEAAAYVFFYFGDWQTISRFAFGVVAPALDKIEGAAISVKMFNGSEPMGKLSVRTAAVTAVASALRREINRHKSRYSHGRGRIGPRS